MSPHARFLRTFFQVLIAVCAAIPAAVALLPIAATTAAGVVSVAGALVLLVSAVQNGLENSDKIPTLGE